MKTTDSQARKRPLGLLVALLWIFIGSPASAQAPAAPAPSAQVRLRLLAFEPGQASEESYLHDPTAPDSAVGIKAPLKSYLNHESVSAAFSSRRLVLTTSQDRTSLKKPDQILGEATLPADLRTAVLLCLPEAKGAKTRLRILVIDDSKKAFPPGTFRLTNLSPSKVKIELEKRLWEIEPGATEWITDPPVRHGNLCGMKAYVLENKDWRRFGSGIWPHPGPGRVIQCLFYHPVARQIQLRAFDDIPPTDPPPALPR